MGGLSGHFPTQKFGKTIDRSVVIFSSFVVKNRAGGNKWVGGQDGHLPTLYFLKNKELGNSFLIPAKIIF